MAKISFHGPLRHRIRGYLTLNRIAFLVAIGHLFGRRIAPDWGISHDIGIRFWRHQFTKAMGYEDMAVGRAYFYAVQTETDDVYDVTQTAQDSPKGVWFTPAHCTSDKVLLYCNGGGYTFRGPIAHRFGAMLAHHCGARVFMPHYRLTPEHSHPAQSEDALAAWDFLTETHAPENIIVIGDSAGGHMALILLQTLKSLDQEQPALCIGLCPWTDIGERGESMTSNNHYDMVQGWMALQFGRWLDPNNRFGREALSPINHDFTGCAPVYLQAGGREMLRDMIFEFAEVQRALGVEMTLDIWDDMPHDFHIYDSLTTSSREALQAIRARVDAA